MDALSQSVEDACLNAWPAFHDIPYDGWLLRLGGGETRRVNSVNVLGPGARPLAEKIAWCEAVYRAQGLEPCFRIRSTDDPALEEALVARGYEAEGETCTLLMPALPEAAPDRPGIQLTPRPSPAWRAAHAGFLGTAPAAIETRRRLLDRLVLPAAFAALRDPSGVIAAVAYGAVQDGMLCLQWVATDPARRQRGHARAVLASLFAWARAIGATAACLQVEADNAPALALYRGLGFATEINRYHYRRTG